jgi:hypothetical protein
MTHQDKKTDFSPYMVVESIAILYLVSGIVKKKIGFSGPIRTKSPSLSAIFRLWLHDSDGPTNAAMGGADWVVRMSKAAGMGVLF